MWHDLIKLSRASTSGRVLGARVAEASRRLSMRHKWARSSPITGFDYTTLHLSQVLESENEGCIIGLFHIWALERRSTLFQQAIYALNRPVSHLSCRLIVLNIHSTFVGFPVPLTETPSRISGYPFIRKTTPLYHIV
jgi:hypothetical protein